MRKPISKSGKNVSPSVTVLSVVWACEQGETQNSWRIRYKARWEKYTRYIM